VRQGQLVLWKGRRSNQTYGKNERIDVLDFILDTKNYETDIKHGEWHTSSDALQATFKADIKKRPLEYLGCNWQKLQNLNPNFLGALSYGFQDIIREGSFSKSYWPNLIDLIHSIVKENRDKKEYRNCFSAILSVLRDGFTQENKKIEFDKQTIENLLDIISKLVKYDEDYKYSDYERDPMQMRCNSVKGGASELIIELGIVCKEHECYEGRLKIEIRKLLDYVVSVVKKPEVNCTLGIDFNRIGWFDDEWLKENVEKMFEGDMWDVVWGIMFHGADLHVQDLNF